MRIQLIVAAIFLFISCSYSNQDKSSSKNVNMKNVDAVFNSIEGNWKISKRKRNKVVSKCFVCPQIQFTNNETGTIIKPSEEEIKFNYTSSSNAEISFSFYSDQPYFDQSDYSYKHYIENNLENIVLKSKEGNREYTLVRIK